MQIFRRFEELQKGPARRKRARNGSADGTPGPARKPRKKRKKSPSDDEDSIEEDQLEAEEAEEAEYEAAQDMDIDRPPAPPKEKRKPGRPRKVVVPPEEMSDVPNDELDEEDFTVKPEVTTVPQTTRCMSRITVLQLDTHRLCCSWTPNKAIDRQQGGVNACSRRMQWKDGKIGSITASSSITRCSRIPSAPKAAASLGLHRPLATSTSSL